MKKIILSLGTLFIITFAFLSFTTQQTTENELSIGDKMPGGELSMKNIDRKSFSLNQLKKENGLIVIFSCNTCPFVVGSDNFEGWEKEYNELYEFAKETNIGFTLVNSNEAKRENEDSFENMQKHASKMGYRMTYLVDKNSELANLFGAKTTPHVFFFDQNNQLIYKGAISNAWDPKKTQIDSYLYNAIKYTSASHAIDVQSSQPKGCSIKRLPAKTSK